MYSTIIHHKKQIKVHLDDLPRHSFVIEFLTRLETLDANDPSDHSDILTIGEMLNVELVVLDLCSESTSEVNGPTSFSVEEKQMVVSVCEDVSAKAGLFKTIIPVEREDMKESGKSETENDNRLINKRFDSVDLTMEKSCGLLPKPSTGSQANFRGVGRFDREQVDQDARTKPVGKWVKKSNETSKSTKSDLERSVQTDSLEPRSKKKKFSTPLNDVLPRSELAGIVEEVYSMIHGKNKNVLRNFEDPFLQSLLDDISEFSQLLRKGKLQRILELYISVAIKYHKGNFCLKKKE